MPRRPPKPRPATVPGRGSDHTPGPGGSQRNHGGSRKVCRARC
jgi:hypothetical protein